MLAIDTNVVVRYLTGDDPIQFPLAQALIDKGSVFLSSTVVLETDWVLRRAYRLTREDVHEALRALLGLPQVTMEAPELLSKALAWAEAGLDLADALHLAAADRSEAFVTFDKDLVKAAHSLGIETVRELS